MEANAVKQQTLAEFMAPKKSLRIWQIILAALLSLMILGAVFEFTKPKPGPVQMSTTLDSSTYSYVDVTLLSHWLLKVTGDENYTIYEAMDTDGNWFLLTLDDSKAAQLSALQDAYDASATADPQTFVLPEPVRLTGVTHSVDSDDAAQIATMYDNATKDQILDFYGSNYLGEGENINDGNAYGFIIGAAVAACFLIVVIVTASAQRKNYQKSEQRLYELGKLEEAEAEFSAPESIHFEKSKLILSKQFVFCGASGWVLPYGDIGWAYQRVQRSYGIPVGKQIIASLYDGKSAVLANKAVNDQMLNDTARAIFTANPNCLIGYSFDNIKLYRQRVKDYKQNHPK
ncbi:MAG TPA: hypothetical protein PKA81_06045 [Clostridia bacterium]|nr:hypothetical protein [Clostridia bacterium]